MRVVEVPLLDDNYGYLLIDDASKQAAAVDPAEPDKVMAAAAAEGVCIVMVLTTHKHWDHAGGNSGMVRLLAPGTPIYGGVVDGVEACSAGLVHGATLTLGHSISITALHTPGHTMGHVCYYCMDSASPSLDTSPLALVFTGDTLFVGGAGKFFEGSPQDMHTSLYHTLGALPPHTLVYCGHEYTLSNYRFALSLEPHNQALIDANDWATQRRQSGLPTVPSTIGKEWATNPFMRANQQSIRAKVPGSEGLSDVQVLGWIREAKNSFR